MTDESLLSGVEAEQEEKTVDQVEQEEYAKSQEEPTETTEEKTERPEYIDEQFWNEEDGKIKEEDLAKAFKAEQDKALGLRRKLSEKGSIKPPKSAEEYTYTDELTEILPSDSPATSILREKALESGLSKEQFSDFIGKIMPALSEKGLITKAEEPVSPEQQKQEFEEYRSSELAKLGSDGPKVLQKLANWGDGLVNNGILSRDEKPVYESMITDAASMVVLNKLMSLTGEASIPVKTAVADGLPSRAEIDQIISSPEYEAGDARVHAIVKNYFEKTT